MLQWERGCVATGTWLHWEHLLRPLQKHSDKTVEMISTGRHFVKNGSISIQTSIVDNEHWDHHPVGQRLTINRGPEGEIS